jgi:para-nitrobenzyl esterase
MLSLRRRLTSWPRINRSGRGVPSALVLVTLCVMTIPRMHAWTQTPSQDLENTRWQLVAFRGADGTSRTPDERAKYTIQFGAGQVTTRVDCNRGRGSWKSSGQSQIEFGPLALTRARCPAESLHDQIVKHWATIRSYAIKDSHLFLSVADNGGTYEFEPAPKKE